MHLITKLAFIVICLTIFSISCATSSRTPSQTVRMGWQLVEKGDIDGCGKLLSKQFSTEMKLSIAETRKILAELHQDIEKIGGIRSIETLNENILGDNAEVTAEIIGNDGKGASWKHKLIREDGEWKIAAAAPSSAASAPSSTPTPAPVSNANTSSDTSASNANTSKQSSTSKIVMRFIWFGASFSAPIQNGKVTVDAGGQQFLKQTNKKGWLVLDKVPCGENAKITFGNGGLISRNVGESPFPVETSNDHQVTRYVACSNKPVALGAFSWADGDFIGDDMDNIDTCYTCQ